MKVKLLLVLATLLCPCLSSCTRVRYMKEISQVSYTEESGTIMPEAQLYEHIVITRDKVTLTRNGKVPDTTVNEGVWEFEVDARKVATLFEHPETIDCSSIKRVEPEALDIGGGTKSYTIVYAGDKTFYLRYGGGATYPGGMLIVEPIATFIRGLTFPSGAASQYNPPTGQP